MYVTTQQLPHPVEDVFAWQGRPGALERLTPPWQPVRVVQEATSLRDGTAVLGLPGGRRWVARHVPEEYVDGHRFTDRLDSRPFGVPLRWQHAHELTGDGVTVLTDRVDTPIPERFLRPMFAYRHRQLHDDLAAHAWTRSMRSQPLTVALTGSSGTIGRALAAYLTGGGHRVIRLVRGRAAGADERAWDTDAPAYDLFDGVDAVVHLAGASIAGRFTQAHRSAVRESRIGPTRRLAEVARRAGLRTFVSASAIGFYGADRGAEELTETSERGSGFLADVVAEWEAAASAAGGDRTRAVQVRTGIVQTPRGGALRLLRPLFLSGLGGPVGSGEQWLSWIGIDDLLDVYLRALVDDRLTGPVNAVAPAPVTSREYASALGRATRRPSVVPAPAAGPRLLLGAEGARELALASQRVLPARLHTLGHTFRYAEVEGALRHLLGTARDVDRA